MSNGDSGAPVGEGHGDHRLGRWLTGLALAAFLMLGRAPLAESATPLGSPDPDPYQIDHWGTDEGLPENSATAMAQSPEGYLWFGTFNGLVRFDGVRFEVFNPVNTPVLPGAAIVNLHLDRTARLWVSTDRGLASLADGRWRRFGTNEGWVGNYVRTFAERPNGDLLLTTFDGKVLEFAEDRLRALPPPPGEPGQGYFGHVDESGRWWVIQNRFIGRWDAEAWTETIPIDEPIADTVAARTARDGALLLVVRERLQRWHRGALTSSMTLPEWSGGTWSVDEDGTGNVWISTYARGVCRIQPDGTFRRWSATNGLPHSGTRFVFEDRERNLWIGTSGGGLVRFKDRRFRVLGADSGLRERNCRSVWPEGSGRLWVATFGAGLFRLDARGAEHPALPGFESRTVYGHTVVTDRGGTTWMGALARGAWRIEGPAIVAVDPEALGGRTVNALFEDSRGRVWFGGDRGLALAESNVVRPFVLPGGTRLPGVVAIAEHPEDTFHFTNLEGVFRWREGQCVELHAPDGEALRDVLCLRPNPDGSIWMGTRNGGLLHWREGSLRRLDASVGFPSRGVHAILEDDRGCFWMPSHEGITRALRSDLEAVAQGRAGHLECQQLDTSDGLVSVDCPSGHQPVAAKGPDGRLWFATLKGVATIDPAAFRRNTHPPPVRIETLAYRVPGIRAKGDSAPGRVVIAPTVRSSPSTPPLSGETQHQLASPFVSPVRIPASGHGIEIRYTALSFSAPEKVRFRVCLQPQDAHWQDAADLRAAYYHDLPPGDYRFQVQAANNDGVWNMSGASLAFSVQPYPWQTRGFLIGTAALLVGGSVLATRMRYQAKQRAAVATLERERRHQAELAHFGRVAALGQMASSIAHELNQPLGAILRNAEAAELILRGAAAPDLDELRAILADIRQDDDRASEVLRRMRSLLKRRAFQAARLDPGTLVDELARFVEVEFRTRKTRLHLDLPPHLPAVAGDRVQLQQVVLNLLLNALDAVGHLPPAERQVWLSARAVDEGVHLVVEDNGAGFAPDARPRLFEPFFTTKPDGLGMGLPIARSIVEAHGGSLSAGPRPGGGARFLIQLPPSTLSAAS